MGIGESIYRNIPAFQEGTISKAPETMILFVLMKPLLGQVSIPPPRKDQGPSQILLDDILSNKVTC